MSTLSTIKTALFASGVAKAFSTPHISFKSKYQAHEYK